MSCSLFSPIFPPHLFSALCASTDISWSCNILHENFLHVLSDLVLDDDFTEWLRSHFGELVVQGYS
jgi:hypothetical protein